MTTEPGGLFEPLFISDQLLAATGDVAWLQAMLDAEAALAHAEADAGVIPPEAAAAIAACCRADRFDPAELGRAARAGGNPVIPLVTALTAAVPEDARGWVHWGATSQDVLDTAAVLVTTRALQVIDADLDRLAAACAELARRERTTVMAGRTMLQHAVPITFGLKAAGWLDATLDARRGLRFAADGLAAQLGGAAGTLAPLGDAGPTVAAGFAHRLGLAEPTLPWHSARQRVALLGSALGVLAGTTAKVAVDVALLGQTEVGEASEHLADGAGGSSTMPTKRNPVTATLVNAAARRCHALVLVLLGALVDEHERGIGAWHAEWVPLTDLLALAGTAAGRTADLVADLEIDRDAMTANLVASGGVVVAERVSFTLARELGRAAAKDAVTALERRARAEGVTFDHAVRSDATVARIVGPDGIDELLEGANYLGSTQTWIDRALARHDEETD